MIEQKFLVLWVGGLNPSFIKINPCTLTPIIFGYTPLIGSVTSLVLLQLKNTTIKIYKDITE